MSQIGQRKCFEMLFHDGHSLADDIKNTLDKGEDLNTILDPQIQFVEDLFKTRSLKFA